MKRKTDIDLFVESIREETYYKEERIRDTITNIMAHRQPPPDKPGSPYYDIWKYYLVLKRYQSLKLIEDLKWADEEE